MGQKGKQKSVLLWKPREKGEQPSTGADHSLGKMGAENLPLDLDSGGQGCSQGKHFVGVVGENACEMSLEGNGGRGIGNSIE